MGSETGFEVAQFEVAQESYPPSGRVELAIIYDGAGRGGHIR